MKIKKKIIIDLDVVTVAFWDNKDDTKLNIERLSK